MVSSRALPPEFEQGVVSVVHQGDCLVTGDADLTYSTVLGSCIAACIRDREAGVGGMNHFLLAAPAGGGGDRFGASARYGAFAMEQLINKVLTRGTGRKSNLDIKVFGGGMIHGALADIGAQNIAFVREFLGNEGYRLASEDLGGSFARRVLFRPSSGRVLVKRLEATRIEAIARAELAEARRPVAPGGIELF